MKPPHLADTHPQYPDGFPERLNDELLGHWETPKGMVVVEDHHHGYEIHFNPCYECDACTSRDFRSCGDRGPIVTVAGGEAGHRTVLEYLAIEESPPHVAEFNQLLADEAEQERLFREAEREEHERQMVEQDAQKPSPEERLAALEAELSAFKAEIN